MRVVHHAQDDSVFIGHEYLVKGVPGRLLMWMLDAYQDAGRLDFTNREIRADAALRLPELKDNLETRLLLLQRRFEEKRAPVRLQRPARGRPSGAGGWSTASPAGPRASCTSATTPGTSTPSPRTSWRPAARDLSWKVGRARFGSSAAVERSAPASAALGGKRTSPSAQVASGIPEWV